MIESKLGRYLVKNEAETIFRSIKEFEIIVNEETREEFTANTEIRPPFSLSSLLAETTSRIDAVGTGGGSGGVPGGQGAPGVNGIDGVDGKDGIPGTNGQDGNDGANGTPGTPGANGADGADGQDGNDGTPGAAGTDGVDAEATKVANKTTAFTADIRPNTIIIVEDTNKVYVSKAMLVGGVDTIDSSVTKIRRLDGAPTGMLLADGSVEMDASYIPTHPKDIVTLDVIPVEPAGSTIQRTYKGIVPPVPTNGEEGDLYLYQKDTPATVLVDRSAEADTATTYIKLDTVEATGPHSETFDFTSPGGVHYAFTRKTVAEFMFDSMNVLVYIVADNRFATMMPGVSVEQPVTSGADDNKQLVIMIPEIVNEANWNKLYAAKTIDYEGSKSKSYGVDFANKATGVKAPFFAVTSDISSMGGLMGFAATVGQLGNAGRPGMFRFKLDSAEAHAYIVYEKLKTEWVTQEEGLPSSPTADGDYKLVIANGAATWETI